MDIHYGHDDPTRAQAIIVTLTPGEARPIAAQIWRAHDGNVCSVDDTDTEDYHASDRFAHAIAEHWPTVKVNRAGERVHQPDPTPVLTPRQRLDAWQYPDGSGFQCAYCPAPQRASTVFDHLATTHRITSGARIG